MPVVEGASVHFLLPDDFLQSVDDQFMKLHCSMFLAAPLLSAEVLVMQLEMGKQDLDPSISSHSSTDLVALGFVLPRSNSSKCPKLTHHCLEVRVEPWQIVHALHYVNLLCLLALAIGAGHLSGQKLVNFCSFNAMIYLLRSAYLSGVRYIK